MASWPPQWLRPCIKEKQICPAHMSKFHSNCLHIFRTENKLKSREKVCKNKDFCGIVMPSEKDNILELNQYMKSD